jgi:DNA ligase-associated metallophosphoesterase
VNAAPVHLAGERLMLDPSGVLFWPDAKTLVVSDLHLEKGSAFARRGMLLPPFDTRVTLERLATQIRAWQPRVVVALGDSFHDRHGAARLAAADQARIAAMTEAADFVWVQGNHDPAPPHGFPGEAAAEYTVGPLVFRHQAAVGASGEVSGHFHPKALVPARGCSVSRPCFVTDGRRLMLPAFGAYTGGLDVRSPAIGAAFPRGGRVFLLGQTRLFSFSLASLRAGPAVDAPGHDRDVPHDATGGHTP